MRTTLSVTTTALIMLMLFAAILLFHMLIVLGVIPYAHVWGGRLTTREAMYAFESVSIALNLFMMGVVAVKGGYWKLNLPKKLITILLWCMVILFSLNTIGNLLATNVFEQVFGTLFTFLLALLSLRLALKKD